MCIEFVVILTIYIKGFLLLLWTTEIITIYCVILYGIKARFKSLNFFFLLPPTLAAVNCIMSSSSESSSTSHTSHTTPSTIFANLLNVAIGGNPNLGLQFPQFSFKLDRSNYSVWRSNVIDALDAFELVSFITTDSSPIEFVEVPATELVAAS